MIETIIGTIIGTTLGCFIGIRLYLWIIGRKKTLKYQIKNFPDRLCDDYVDTVKYSVQQPEHRRDDYDLVEHLMRIQEQMEHEVSYDKGAGLYNHVYTPVLGKPFTRCKHGNTVCYLDSEGKPINVDCLECKKEMDAE